MVVEDVPVGGVFTSVVLVVPVVASVPVVSVSVPVSLLLVVVGLVVMVIGEVGVLLLECVLWLEITLLVTIDEALILYKNIKKCINSYMIVVGTRHIMLSVH